ncbi:hypothetical protein BH23BAC3_BH23BAC3_35470 [soil metagenome]
MTNPSIWMIRLSLLYLLISASTGGMILSHKAITIHPMIWGLLPFHYELAVWGWLVQFVMGAAYWMFPKKLAGERRGPVPPAWVMIILFNSGLLILSTSTFYTAIVGRSLMTIAILIFIILMWQRVVTYRK